MADNIEIKARISPEQAERVESLALGRSTREAQHVRQRDTFYRVRSGRLKLREFHEGGAELIAYERPDQAGPKHSSYVCSPCADPATIHHMLSRTIGVRGIVEKERVVIHVGQTRVHLDEVAGLGTFLELEVVLRTDQSQAEGEAIAIELMKIFEIDANALVEVAYIDLVEAAATRADRWATE